MLLNTLVIIGEVFRMHHQLGGSTEDEMNKMVKRVLGSVLAERRLSGQNPNWTEVLGRQGTYSRIGPEKED